MHVHRHSELRAEVSAWCLTTCIWFYRRLQPCGLHLSIHTMVSNGLLEISLYRQHICWPYRLLNHWHIYGNPCYRYIYRIRSFMNIIKRKGPHVESCCTPVVTSRGPDNTTSYFTRADNVNTTLYFMHW